MNKHDVCDGVFINEYLLLCDAMICLFDVDKYGDVDFMSILMSDDDVLLCCFYCRVTYIALATRAFMPSDDGLYAKCS